MKNLKEYFKDTDLSKLALPSNVGYGKAIFKRGAVVIINNSNTEVEAWAGGLEGTLKQGAGSKRRVQLWLDKGKLHSHCTGNPKITIFFVSTALRWRCLFRTVRLAGY